MLHALARHWPEYLIEGSLLGTFMVLACLAVCIFEHPGSPVHRAIRSAVHRRTIIGLLMGLTAVALVYSPAGERSGAHMNPGATLAFLTLGKIMPWDAIFYVVAQFAGGLAGVWLAGLLLRDAIRHRSVNFAVTEPPRDGARAAFRAWGGEFAISFAMMGIVLLSSNHAGTAPYTGIFAGLLLAAYITVEAPLSGMSLNPARTLASAIPARSFRGLWIYFTAPPLAMLCAAGAYAALEGKQSVYCAKLAHPCGGSCIFECQIERMPGRVRAAITPDDARPIGPGSIEAFSTFSAAADPPSDSH